jgi:uncharacterized protein (DUF169 family)
MELKEKKGFIDLWKRHFNGASLPIAFYYTNVELKSAMPKPTKGHRCIFSDISHVLQGNTRCFNADVIGCTGGRRYLGFSQELRPYFEYFLSCGLPGKVEGERYKKSPEIVKEAMRYWPRFEAPARYIIFKRWDMLEEPDDPDVVTFFATPDVLSGLFTLANYDQVEPNGVFAPFSAGCASIVQYPYLEKDSNRPRCVLGLFDVSARPFIPEGTLSFSVPITKFKTMVENMEESFLITKSWKKIRRRIKQ